VRSSSKFQGLIANGFGLVVLAIVFICFGCASRQDIGAVDQNVPSAAADDDHNATLSASSIKALEEFEAAPAAGYQLGPGDVVDVTLWGHPELSGKHTIGPDGKIQIPFVGSLRISEMTADQAAEFITVAVSEDYKGPVATVQIEKYTDNQILVLGHVSQPGVMHFVGPPTLLEALARASGNTDPTDEFGKATGANLGTSITPLTRCAVFRGTDRVAWIDLRPLLSGQAPLLNIRLMRNDVVYVPDPSDRIIYVMGQVSKPGAYPLTPHMSFLEALTTAGGPTDAAQQSKIILVHPSKHIQQVVDLHDYLNGNNVQNYALTSGDIVYVPKNGLATLGWVMQQISPITSSIIFGAAIF
jgi:polysaccharide export outer membrane protein